MEASEQAIMNLLAGTFVPALLLRSPENDEFEVGDYFDNCLTDEELVGQYSGQFRAYTHFSPSILLL